jgi:hypothetical protein
MMCENCGSPETTFYLLADRGPKRGFCDDCLDALVEAFWEGSERLSFSPDEPEEVLK